MSGDDDDPSLREVLNTRYDNPGRELLRRHDVHNLSTLERQAIAGTWCRKTFGEVANSVEERVRRMLEEAMELAQAEGISHVMAAKIMDRVYSRPPGNPYTELGDVCVTTLNYAHVRGFNRDACEAERLVEVMSRDPQVMRDKHQAKVDEGIAEG